MQKKGKDRCLFTSSENPRLRSVNSYAITKNQEYIQILSFIQEGDEGFVGCKILKTQSNSENNHMPIRRVMAYNANEQSAKDIREINTICVSPTILNVN